MYGRSAMATFSPLDTTELSRPLDWADWGQCFIQYRIVTKLKEEEYLKSF